MPSFKENIREILYNDVRNAGHGVAVFDQFLEFDAVVGSFVNASMFQAATPSQSAGVSQAIVSAKTTLAPELPEIIPPPPVAQQSTPLPPAQTAAAAQPPPLPELTTPVQSPSPPVSLSPRPAPREVDSIPVVPERASNPPLPELPTSAPQITPSPVVATVPVASAQAPAVPELPEPLSAQPTSLHTQTREPWTHDDVLNVLRAPPVPQLPPPTPPQKSLYRSSTPDDPTGQKEYVEEKATEQIAMTNIVEAIHNTQQELTKRQHDADETMVSMLERTARDVGNNSLRLRSLYAAHQRSAVGLTDTNFAY